MTYKTFRALLFVGGGLAACGAIAGAYVACRGDASETGSTSTTSAKPQSTPKPTTTVAPSPPTQTVAPATSAADASALRPMDQKILDKAHAGITGDKIKDAFKGETYKVNFYKEDGKTRAKVDLDRDEKFDEKWDFDSEGGEETVKRRVATKDDENYDLEYRLREGKWVLKQP